MVRNNIKGQEASLLKRYEEPAWNNPVVRFFRGDGQELLKRKDRVWSLEAYGPRVVAALEAAQRPVPLWLKLARDEVSGERARVLFAMPCFWEGEARLGALDGVIATEPGFAGGREVVEVSYDPSRIALGELIERADALKCSLHVFALDQESLGVALAKVGERASLLAKDGLRGAKESDSLYHLRRRPALFALPATPLQRIRLNAALRTGGDVSSLLSPRQNELLKLASATAVADLKGMTPPADFYDLARYEERFRQALAN